MLNAVAVCLASDILTAIRKERGQGESGGARCGVAREDTAARQDY